MSTSANRFSAGGRDSRAGASDFGARASAVPDIDAHAERAGFSTDGNNSDPPVGSDAWSVQALSESDAGLASDGDAASVDALDGGKRHRKTGVAEAVPEADPPKADPPPDAGAHPVPAVIAHRDAADIVILAAEFDVVRSRDSRVGPRPRFPCLWHGESGYIRCSQNADRSYDLRGVCLACKGQRGGTCRLARPGGPLLRRSQGRPGGGCMLFIMVGDLLPYDHSKSEHYDLMASCNAQDYITARAVFDTEVDWLHCWHPPRPDLWPVERPFDPSLDHASGEPASTLLGIVAGA